MTSPDEILRTMYDETLVGNAPRVLELTNEALAMGMEPQSLLFDSLIPALEEVGQVLEAALGDPGVGDQVNIHPAAPSRPPKVAAGP